MLNSLPPVSKALIIANVVVFLLQSVTGHQLDTAFALWPPLPAGNFGFDGVGRFEVWQVVTYAFLHGSITHLLFNMLGLFMFGGEMERVWGPRRYTIYYFTCVIGAAVAQLVVATQHGGPPYATLGASGGVFGLLLAFGMMFPRRMILLILPPIPMPAWLFVTIYGIVELVLGVTGTQEGVAHFAHLGGMASGFLLLQYWRGRFPFRRR
jgi:membrane associated rhomboid family serine protease